MTWNFLRPAEFPVLVKRPHNNLYICTLGRTTEEEPSKRTLVCFIGSLRGGPDTWKSLKHHLVNKLDADVAILTDKDTDISEMSHIMSPRYIWITKEYDNWATFMDETFSIAWRKKVTLQDNLWGGVDNLKGSGAIVMILRLVMLKYLDKIETHNYERLIVTRTDNYFLCDETDVWPKKNEVFTPDGVSKWGGVTDKHTIAHFDSREKILNVLPWILEKNIHGNLEVTLNKFYEAGGLKTLFTRRNHFTSTYVDPVTMKADQFRWSQPVKECYKGLWLKKPWEYNESLKFCHHEICNSTRMSEKHPLKSGSNMVQVVVKDS